MRSFVLAALAGVQAAPTCTNCAFVDSCDDKGTIKMEARIQKDKVMAIPDGFQDIPGAFYVATFTQADLTPTFEGDNLIMTKSIDETYPIKINDKDGNKITVYKQTGHSLSFKCSYALEDKVVKQDFNVAGHDHEDSAENTGNLGYKLKMIENCDLDPDNCVLYKIGSTAGFTITPNNPDLVYASIKSCEVHRNSAHVQIIGEGGDMCLNKFLNSQLTSYTSKYQLSGSFTAFKWSTTVGDPDPEGQSLECTIGLSKEESSTKPNNDCPIKPSS